MASQTKTSKDPQSLKNRLKTPYSLLLSLLLFSGCDSVQGVREFSGTLTDFREKKAVKQDVWITISQESPLHSIKTIHLKRFPGDPSNDLDFKPLRWITPGSSFFGSLGRTHRLEVAGLTSESTPVQFKLQAHRLKKDQQETHCFLGQDSSTHYHAALCLNDASFSLKLTDLLSHRPLIQIQGNPIPPAHHQPTFEPPTTLTLNQAIKLATAQSTELRVENQILFRAKRSSIAGKLALFPHISLNLYQTAFVPGSPLGVMAILGDLAPFLFPSRWLKAQADTLQYQIEQDTARIVQLNLISQVENLAYLYVRDWSTYLKSSQLKERWVKEVIPSLRHLEAQGALPAQSTNLALSYSDQATEDLRQLRNTIQDDLYTLALALNFFNPRAITHLELEEADLSIEQAPLCQDPFRIAEQAYRVSIERRQLLTARRLAQNEKKTLYFLWFDPEGSSQTSLGLGLFEQFQMKNSSLIELELKEEQIQKSLYNTAEVTCRDYNRSLNSYEKLRTIQKLREEVFEQTLTRLKEAQATNGNFRVSVQDFSDSLDKLLKSTEDLAQAISHYRIHRTRLHRMLLKGRYQDALTPDPEEVVSHPPSDPNAVLKEL
ncbi:MAG: hypothetical protein ACO3A2_07050 [Bdellovibrionia bacterium]